MNKKIPQLSIFFPFWNEDKNIEYVITRAIEVAKAQATSWEILMVDDGSEDKTREIALKLASTDPRLKVISLHPNKGYGAALKAGLHNAKYDVIVFTDGDRQFDFSEVTTFLEQIKSSDMVVGFRKQRRDEKIFKRLLLMNLLKIWDFILFRFYFKDIDCGFKMFTRHALTEIGQLHAEGAMITTEIFAKATKKKLTIAQVGVTHYPRKFGKQTGANLYVILRALLESMILWLDIRYKRF